MELAGRPSCRICGTFRNLTRHHLVPQHWFRRRKTFGSSPPRKNDPCNLVLLCCYCHQSVEGQRGLDRRTRSIRLVEARRKLREALFPSEVKYIVSVRGELWLESHYPRVVVRHQTTRARALDAWKARFAMSESDRPCS